MQFCTFNRAYSKYFMVTESNYLTVELKDQAEELLITTQIYRVIQEESALLWEMIV